MDDDLTLPQSSSLTTDLLDRSVSQTDLASPFFWGRSSGASAITDLPQADLTPPPIQSGSATYYVATYGSDSNTGDIASPFASLQHAINLIGDGQGGTIYLRGGVYNVNQGIWIGPEHDGSENSQLTIRAYEEEDAIIDGSGMWRDDHQIAIAGQYVNIIGLEVRNGKDAGIVVLSGNHVQILNNIVHSTDSTGILALGVEWEVNGQSALFRASDVWMVGNQVYNTNQMNSDRDLPGGWGMGMQGMFADRVHILNNRVFQNYGEGIGFTVVSDSIAANNLVYDNFSVEMYLDNARNSSFANNFIINTGNQAFYRPDSAGRFHAANGIQLANEIYNTEAYTLSNNAIRNNIVVGGEASLFYGNYQSANGMIDTYIENNVFYNAQNQLLRIDNDGYLDGIRLINNIFYQVNDQPLVYFPNGIQGLEFDHNLWYGGDPGLAAKPTDVLADPLLLNPGGYSVFDYQLQADSAAIDTGTWGNVLDDILGNDRPQGSTMDIGAFEFLQ
jgi:hypothetical protein